MGCDGKDLIRPVGPLPDGYVAISRHRPDHTTEMVIARRAIPGKPMATGEEYVSLKNLGDGSYEVTGSYVHGTKSGPAQVATEDFRAGWERTFPARGGDA